MYLQCCNSLRVTVATCLTIIFYVAKSSAFYFENLQQLQRQMQIEPFVRSLDELSQLIIFDPFSGRNMQPFRHLPLVMGNPIFGVSNNLIELPKLWNPCSCSEFKCFCCLGLEFTGNFKNRICASLEYNYALAAIQLGIAYNENTIANFDFSIQNPPDFCLPLMLPLPVFSCLRIYDIQTLDDGKVQLCLSIVIKLFTNQIFEYQFECFRLGLSGIDLSSLEKDEAEEEAVEQLQPKKKQIRNISKNHEKMQQSLTAKANDKLNAEDFLLLSK